jgi:hypothetical protein
MSSKHLCQQHPDRKVKAYVLIDDKSNCSLAKLQLFVTLNIDGEMFPYTLRTCAGTMQTEGRHVKCFVIESLDGHKRHLLPTITECNAISDNKDEIPTPDIAMAHPTWFCSLGVMYHHFTKFESLKTEGVLSMGTTIRPMGHIGQYVSRRCTQTQWSLLL